ncbi:MAG: tail fiber protein [Chloroflexota bacterium]
MAEPFLGEIRMFGFDFPPRDWAHCDGQILSINQNQNLYSILGTTYGGDGRTTFALPDLRGRSPVHRGDEVRLGNRGGAETVELVPAEIPSHSHTVNTGNASATSNTPNGNLLAQAPVYGNDANLTTMSNEAISRTGGGQGHNNLQPYLVINFCISLQGQFPPRN